MADYVMGYPKTMEDMEEHFCKNHTGLMVGHCEGPNIVLKCVGWFRSPKAYGHLNDFTGMTTRV